MPNLLPLGELGSPGLGIATNIASFGAWLSAIRAQGILQLRELRAQQRAYWAAGAAAGAPFFTTKSVVPKSPTLRVNLIVSPSALPV